MTTLGMYDYLRCDYPLPGTPPSYIFPGHVFQTKSLDCQMETYVIGSDGAFSEEGFTGVIEFYDSNIVASGPAIYTRNGEDAESVSYEAKIVDGKLASLNEAARETKPAFPASKQRQYTPPTPEQLLRRQVRETENLVGRDVYVLWGGQDIGYWAKVTYQRQGEHRVSLCVDHDGKLEILNMHDRDRIFWDTEEEALEQHARGKGAWAAGVREYEEYCAKRTAEAGPA